MVAFAAICFLNNLSMTDNTMPGDQNIRMFIIS